MLNPRTSERPDRAIGAHGLAPGCSPLAPRAWVRADVRPPTEADTLREQPRAPQGSPGLVQCGPRGWGSNAKRRQGSAFGGAREAPARPACCRAASRPPPRACVYSGDTPHLA